MFVSVPEFPCFVFVVKVLMPVVAGAVTPLKATVNWALAAQVMLMGMVHGPVPVMVPRVAAEQAGAGPVVTTTLLEVGAVHPAGTRIVAWEPGGLKSLPLGAAKVNVRVLPMVPAMTLVGLTVIVPSPSMAGPASGNVVCATNPEDWPTAVTVNVRPASLSVGENDMLMNPPTESATIEYTGSG